MSAPCIALLGGSFDPVHNGHVALGGLFAKLLFPDMLRILPAGAPWQRQPLAASAQDRVAMVRLAFAGLPVPVTVDTREIERDGPTYTIDTLRAIRRELGPSASLAFVMGADQLQNLHTWKDWEQLFDCAHLCAASRPGFTLSGLPPPVAREFGRRMASAQQIRETPHGLCLLAENLAIDVSATQIRTALARGEVPAALLPPAVLDYIKIHHLYRS